jgi:hypothetical protein
LTLTSAQIAIASNFSGSCLVLFACENYYLLLANYDPETQTINFIRAPETLPHGLIRYIMYIAKAKCRHLKKLICRGTLRHVFIRIYRLDPGDVGIFDPAL